MPIGEFEREVLGIIAANRTAESFVGGATVLHVSPTSPRASADVDVFHDSTEALRVAAEQDLESLRLAGYVTEVLSQQEGFIRARILKSGRRTKIEWVRDSVFRFFPVEPDVQLGWKLNFWDAATNKVLAFVGRDELRDWLDVIYLHRHHLHLGALVWAAAAKDPGLSPEFILDCGRRFQRLPVLKHQLERIDLRVPFDPVAHRRELMAAIAEAEALVERLPVEEMGCFYLDHAGKPVCPDPTSPEFPKLTRHFGSIKGALPRIVEE
jgi:hypothetical protein